MRELSEAPLPILWIPRPVIWQAGSSYRIDLHGYMLPLIRAVPFVMQVRWKLLCLLLQSGMTLQDVWRRLGVRGQRVRWWKIFILGRTIRVDDLSDWALACGSVGTFTFAPLEHSRLRQTGEG